MNIVLTGFMASGKTLISRAISQISHYKAVDTDEMIMKKAGMSVNEIFAKYGEERFRALERDAIREAAAMDNAVISTGGGAVLDKRNIDALRETGIIFNLNPDFSVIEERLEEAKRTRPLLQQDSIENIKKRFDARKPFYDNCDFSVAVINGRTPRSYAMEILKKAERP